MVKFIKVTFKKFKAEIVDSQLISHDLDSIIQHEEDRVNYWLLKGFEVQYVLPLEDLKGKHMLFVLYKKPPTPTRGKSK